MMFHRKARITIILSGLLSLSLLYWGVSALRAKSPSYEHPMIDFTRNMKTVCLGRFLVDIPEQMHVDKYWQSIAGFGDIEVLGREHQTRSILDLVAEKRELELRKTRHAKEGTVFRESVALGDSARLLVFRNNEISTRSYDFETFVLSDGRLLKLKYGADNERLEEAKEDVALAITQIQRRENNVIPQGKGVCIDGGLIADAPEYRRESNSLRLVFKEYPGFELKAHIDSTDNPQTESLLETAGLLPKLAAFYGDVSFNVLRKTRRTLDEVSGEELATCDVERKKNGDQDSLSFTWKYNGEPSSLRHPAVTFDMGYDFGDEAMRLAHEEAYRDGKASPPPPKRLTKEEAIVIWDAVLNSFRPRPGAF
jgi:hypothetical protein